MQTEAQQPLLAWQRHAAIGHTLRNRNDGGRKIGRVPYCSMDRFLGYAPGSFECDADFVGRHVARLARSWRVSSPDARTESLQGCG
jgi:hypothetical protein